MFCSECGKEINAENFCPYCGSKLDKKSEKVMMLKNRKHVTYIKGCAIVVCIVVVFIICKNIFTSPSDKVLSYLERNKVEDAWALYEDKILQDEEELQKIIEAVNIILDKVVSDYYADACTYEETSETLSVYEKYAQSKCSEVKDKIEYLKQSKDSFDAAEEKFVIGNYFAALGLYKTVIQEDSNYDSAQKKIKECEEKLPQLTSEQIIEDIYNCGANYMSFTNRFVYMDITDVEIVSQTLTDGEKVDVECNIIMTAENICAKESIELVYELNEKGYQISSHSMGKVEYVRPIKGVEENYEDVKGAIKDGYYSEIWEDSKTAPEINLELIERNTDLENGLDILKYSYQFSTYTAKYSGEITMEYRFYEGEWDAGLTHGPEVNMEWMLEGMWKFDIFTYYVEVNIKNMDWVNMQADVEYRGSVWQGGGTVYEGTISFAEGSDGIVFESFTIPSEGWASSDKTISLWAKFNDMYYQSPSIFNGAEPVYLSVGGKTE